MNHEPMMTTLLNVDECYEAMEAKDRRYDGRFVVAVSTTGIFCRPSCPARTPFRQNVTFYATGAEAEAAGFRACKRCSPHTQAFEAAITERVCRHLDAHVEARLKLDDLGALVGMSPQHLQRVFKRTLGISPREYHEALRLTHLKARLKAGDSVTDALYEAGYSSTSRLYENAAATLGMTPATFRSGGKGAVIHYTITPCAMGQLLVAATEQGVCAVCLGDNVEVLEAELHADYPAATIHHDPALVQDAVQTVLDYLAGNEPHLELPLDVRGTAFQWQVWQHLRTIPLGETRSYSQIAAAIGNPDATRAVAQACASNKVALVIPCHRVIRTDGSLGGYRWGVERKVQLLQQEQEYAAS
jgi:AraC family transcriptional regulator, regulatory protein of adaptative response / methylated-DNA-[protein]-cysteine methyltransferase